MFVCRRNVRAQRERERERVVCATNSDARVLQKLRKEGNSSETLNPNAMVPPFRVHFFDLSEKLSRSPQFEPQN